MCILSVRASHPRNGEEEAGQAEGRWAQKRLHGRPAHPEYAKAKAVSFPCADAGHMGKAERANLELKKIPI